jgi:hypothetical protein
MAVMPIRPTASGVCQSLGNVATCDGALACLLRGGAVSPFANLASACR